MARIFNGTSHYLRVTPAVRNALAVTYAAWFKPTNVDNGANVGCIIAQSDEASTGNFSTLSQYQTATRASCRMGGATFSSGATLVTPSGWSLAIGTIASDVSRTFWLNGKKETSTTDAGTFTANYDNVTIGGLRRTTVSDYYDGKIHSAAIWNRALTDAEVAALNAGLPLGAVGRADLVGHWSDLGASLVGEVGGTLVDVIGTTTVDGDAPPLNTGVRKVYALSSVAGLKRWVDYIPVKVSTAHTAASVGTYNDNGAMLVNPLASVTGLTAWIDYLPVYVVADTNGYSYDDDGYLLVTGV